MKTLKATITSAVAITAMTVIAAANNIESSKVGIGIKNLVNDLMSWLMVLGPIVAGCACVYFFIRRSMADEVDGKMWNKRISVALLCGVAVFAVAGIINLLIGYIK
jgi:ABC-type molybdate transport system permease subunit